ncbi:MAG: biopolymer transporter ExbD, partial [Bacteroidaceae bacterium]|nr:biopolymer transporter ExbD [Bacteroidaceae bacterium]
YGLRSCLLPRWSTFMLCTTLIKPQTMQITMPSDKDDIKQENKSQVASDKAITIILDKDDKIYYFEGKPSEATTYETAYGKDGIRAVLMAKNAQAQAQVKALDKEFAGRWTANVQQDQKNREEYKKRLSDIKNSDITPSAIIKATDDATYLNLINALDEMQICCIGKYVIDKINEQDLEMIQNAVPYEK